MKRTNNEDEENVGTVWNMGVKYFTHLNYIKENHNEAFIMADFFSAANLLSIEIDWVGHLLPPDKRKKLREDILDYLENFDNLRNRTKFQKSQDLMLIRQELWDLEGKKGILKPLSMDNSSQTTMK